MSDEEAGETCLGHAATELANSARVVHSEWYTTQGT